MGKNIEALAEVGEESLRKYIKEKMREVEKNIQTPPMDSRELRIVVKVYRLFAEISQEEYGLDFYEETKQINNALRDAGYDSQGFKL